MDAKSYEQFICEKFYLAWNPEKDRDIVENEVIEDVINSLDWETLPAEIMAKVCPSYIRGVVARLIDFEDLVSNSKSPQ